MFFCLLFFCIPSTGFASGATPNPEGELFLFTCRSMYATGEKIRFAAGFVPADDKAPPDAILYAELVDPGGRVYMSAKYTIEDNYSSGELAIPEEILTGYYYIRVYTRSMRSLGPSAYTYLRLKIVNPFLEDFLPGNAADSSSDACCVLPGLLKTQCTIRHRNDSSSVYSNCLLRLQAPEKDEVSCLFVSVVPAHTGTSPNRFRAVAAQSAGTRPYAPDIRGLSLSGIVTRDGAPYPDCKIFLSLNCPDKDIVGTTSDSLGQYRFAFAADAFCGNLFITAQDIKNENIRLDVDKEYCQIPFSLPGPPFSLSDEERDVAYFISLNRQLDKHFRDNSPAGSEKDFQNPTAAFYGEPSLVLRMDDFVELPELEEYFNELPSQAKVRTENGKKTLRVLIANTGFAYLEPLILLDFLPVFDVEKILSIAPESIERIEIVNKPYTKGEMIFGGIVSIITKRKDFAGYDFPLSGRFIRFGLPEKGKQEPATKAIDPRKPDMRNVFYWGVHPVQNELEELSFDFPTPQHVPSYQVRVAALTRSGRMLYGECFVRP